MSYRFVNPNVGIRMARCSALPQRESNAALLDKDVALSGPSPKRFAVAEGQLNDILRASCGTLLRLGAGALVGGYNFSMVQTTDENKSEYAVARVAGYQSKETSSSIKTYTRPVSQLILFHSTDCPDSKRVRECLSILDLDALVYPCPSGGPAFDTPYRSDGDTGAVPVLVDPNSGKTISGSGDDIVEYLYTQYGNPNKIPWLLKSNGLSNFLVNMALKIRGISGGSYSGKGLVPEEPLVFWSYEASPFCSVVQEVLCGLAVPHVLITVARGSAKRSILFERRGHFQAPYLYDPNSGVALFESAAIIEYLKSKY